jgi:hypothetical protein
MHVERKEVWWLLDVVCLRHSRECEDLVSLGKVAGEELNWCLPGISRRSWAVSHYPLITAEALLVPYLPFVAYALTAMKLVHLLKHEQTHLQRLNLLRVMTVFHPPETISFEVHYPSFW